ncbi:hypothetical protein BurJ1DRAFT_2340 [Burkholderiales bacterium JOSHI_001]|nr:hypothetical protein BurJ1DRAFT_2340 [Burkholderiales bacterium JOSHI_001]
MPMLPEAPTAVPATFAIIDGSGDAKPFPVQFNPASLEYTSGNTFDDSHVSHGVRQFTRKSVAKLSLTLVFDTTLASGGVKAGSDVGTLTRRLSRLVEPAVRGSQNPPPKIEFAWGSYRFKGVIEQYKETVDFFSATGVPLRSTVAITLAEQGLDFVSVKNPPAAADARAALNPDPVVLPKGTSPDAAAGALGDPRAARGIAALNNAPTLRFGASAALAVGGSVAIGAPVAFSAGASASLSLGASAGAALSLGADAGLSAGAGAGLSVGGSAGLDITATAGAAFGGLRVGAGAGAGATSTVSVASARAALLPAAGASAASSFAAGGRVSADAGASLSADLGATADLHAGLSFGG